MDKPKQYGGKNKSKCKHKPKHHHYQERNGAQAQGNGQNHQRQHFYEEPKVKFVSKAIPPKLRVIRQRGVGVTYLTYNLVSRFLRFIKVLPPEKKNPDKAWLSELD